MRLAFRTSPSLAWAPLLTAAVAWFPAGADGVALPEVAAFVENHCLTCHDDLESEADLDLLPMLDQAIVEQPDVWETILKRLETRQMPPASEANRPSEGAYESVVAQLTGVLDRHAEAHPRPGRTETLRRLNRTEYQNAIRDLLAVEIDASKLLPADELSHGFDNVTVGTLSPMLLDRYITAAQKISRMATGGESRLPQGETFRVKPDLTQESHVPGLPFGTRGGTIIRHTFPRDGEYEITIRLTRDRNDLVEGLGRRSGNRAIPGAGDGHDVLVLLNRQEVATFDVRPPKGGGHQNVDAHLRKRLEIPAGTHELGVTFLQGPRSVLAYERQPYESAFNYHRHPRLGPAVFQVTVLGPFDSDAPGDSPSRRKIFGRESPGNEWGEAEARAILGRLMRQAWRRPVSEGDVGRLMPYFEAGWESGGFESGIEQALSALLVSREFLFRVETEPEGLEADSVYRVSDLDLATRLSFFIWSSLPDEELLALAEAGELSEPETLEAQVRRMLVDPRSEALVTNFAAQWLHLRNLESVAPDARLFPDFDDNLRQAMRRETELVFEEVLREDRSIVELLRRDHTYLNERLAKHYGIPHIYGSHFRRVELDPETRRGGLFATAMELLADVNARKRGGRGGAGRLNEKGATPFLLAAKRADLAYLRLLVELGADPYLSNVDGSDALHAVFREKGVEIPPPTPRETDPKKEEWTDA